MAHTLKFLTPPQASPVSVLVTITNYQTSGEAVFGNEVGLASPLYGLSGVAVAQDDGTSYPCSCALFGGSAVNLVLLDLPAISAGGASEQAMFQSDITATRTFKLVLTLWGAAEARGPLPTDPSKFPQ